MKHLLGLALLCLSSALGVFAQTAPSPMAKNILFEGAFTEHSADTPEGWNPGGFAGGDHGNRTRVTEDRDGNYVTLFVQDSAKAHFTLALREPIALRPSWKSLLCSVDLRVFNYEQGKESYYRPRMHITFLDDAGKELGSAGVSIPGRYTDAWQTAEREIPIPAGSSSAKVWLGTYGATGQLEFRNPYIAPVE